MKSLLLVSLAIFGTLALNAQTITSVQDGAWDDPATWDVAVPTQANSTSIVVAHNVNIPTGVAVTADQISVSAFATLTIDAGGTLTVANDGTGASDLDVYNDGFDYGFLTVGGTLVCNNLATITGTDGTNALFNSGSIYRHLYTTTEGSIPFASWDAASTVQVQGYTGGITATAGGNWNQSFGNFVFNCTNLGSGVVQLSGQLTDVQNDLTISSTGATGSIRFSNTENPTVAIGRDLIISGTSRALFGAGTNTIVNIGRDFLYSSTNSTGTNFATTGLTTVNVTGNFTMNASGGRLNLASSGNGVLNTTGNFTVTAGSFFFGSASAATGSVNITGNFSNGGTLNEGSSSSSAANVNFVGSATHTFTNSGTFTNSINFSVASLSTLDMGTAVMSGSGTFTLNGTLRLGATDVAGALQAGTSGGNIRVSGTRTYASNSTIVYNGAGAQFIGDGFPPSGLVNLTINNSSGVTLSASLDIVALSVLNLASGNINIGAQTLTINGTVSGSGGITGGATSNLVIGGTGNFGTLTFSGSNQLFNFTLNRTGSGLVTLGGSLTILGTFTHTSGTLALGGNTLTISGAYGPSTPDDLSVTSGSTLVIDGSGTLPTDVGFVGTTLGTLTLNRASSTLPTTSSLTINNLNLTSGTFSNGSGIAIGTGGTVTRTTGSMTGAPTNTSAAYNVVYTSGTISTGPELPTNSTALANLSKTGSGTLTLAADVTVNGTLTLSSGSFNASTFALDLKGNFVSNAASTLTSNTVTFSGTTALSGSSSPVFGAVTITGTLTPSVSYQVNGNLINNGTLAGGTGITTTFGGTTTISGSSSSSFNNVTISGTLTAPAAMSVAGTWTNNGTFNRGAATNTVTFNGTSSVAGTTATTFSGITISGTLNAPSTLTLAGNFTNNGTFNRGTGTVVFAGSSIQNIQGSSVTEFNNISVTNTSGPPSVRVQSNHNLRGTLTLASNSIFDADGSLGTSIFRLRSTSDDPTTDAAIATLPTGAQVTGNVTVQRYMAIEPGPNGNNRLYRNISSPVQSAPVSQVQTFIPISGTFTGQNHSGAQSMFAYDETVTTGDLNSGYIDFPANANTETLATARGYNIFVRGNETPITTAGSALWEVRGVINSGPVGTPLSFPVSFTSSGNVANDGWNLVGNPYPSTIDWNAAAGWSKGAGITGTIYMRDNGDNPSVFATWNGVTGTNGGDRYIAMGQAFWVKSDGSGATTLSADERVKVAGTQTSFFREGTPTDLLRITLRQGSLRDEAVVHFRDDATDAYDSHADAIKMKNTATLSNVASFNLSTISADNLDLAINSQASMVCGRTVKVNLSDLTPGGYSLNFSEFESFSQDVQILLQDALENKTIDVREVEAYDFLVSEQPNSSGANRFSLIFTLTHDFSTVNFEAPVAICDGDAFSLLVKQSDPSTSYEIFSNNQLVGSQVAGNGSDITMAIPMSALQSGLNQFELRYTNVNCLALKGQQLVSVTVTGKPEVVTSDAQRCAAGSVTLVAAGATDGSYRWFDSVDAIVPLTGATSATFVTPLLDKTKTYFVTAVNELGCEGERIEVKALVVYPVEIKSVAGAPVCRGERATLTAEGAPTGGFYRWYETVDGINAIDGQTESEYLTNVLTESKNFFVSVVNESGCESSRTMVAAVVNSVEVSIDAVGSLLISSEAEGNQWYFNGVKIEGATNATYQATESGVYKVEVRKGSCMASSEREMVVTGLEHIDQDKAVQIFPNPTTGHLRVMVSTTDEVVVAVLNSMGQELKHIELASEPGSNFRKAGNLELLEYSPGVYFVKVRVGETLFIRKIVKH